MGTLVLIAVIVVALLYIFIKYVKPLLTLGIIFVLVLLILANLEDVLGWFMTILG